MRWVLVVAPSLLLVGPAPAQPRKPAPRPASAGKAAAAGPDLPSRLPAGAPFCTVNGERITVGTYIDRLSLRFATEMREYLVAETLLKQEAKRRGLAASAAEIQAVSKRAFDQSVRQYNGEKQLEAELARSRGWSLNEYRGVIRGQAEAQVVRERLAAALVKPADIPETELEPLYEARKDSFRQPDRVVLAHILVRRPASGGEAAETAARARAEELLKQVTSARGANFEQVAREKSEDSATAPRGGKIPAEIVRGANPFGAAFEATVFSAPVGIVPEVVATSQGFHVFRVESRKEGRLLPLGEVKEQLRSVVLNERREQALDALLARLRREAKVETGKF